MTTTTVTPTAQADSQLPAECLAYIPENEIGHRIVVIRRGQGVIQSRYDHAALTEETARCLVRDVNRHLGVSPSQREALLAGSLYGWDSPAADPSLYEHLDGEDLLAALPTSGRPH